MNIRSISNPAQILAKEKIEAERSIRSDETDEREGNGQQPQGENQFYRALNEEEVAQVLEKIKSHDGIQKNGLLVVHSFEQNKNIVKVQTTEGKVLRRFIEKDLYNYLFNESDDSLQLVKKIA